MNKSQIEFGEDRLENLSKELKLSKIKTAEILLKVNEIKKFWDWKNTEEFLILYLNSTWNNKKHAGDCTIYSSLINGMPYDGICTCGYGWDCVRNGDYRNMFSKERENQRMRDLGITKEDVANTIPENPWGNDKYNRQ